MNKWYSDCNSLALLNTVRNFLFVDDLVLNLLRPFSFKLEQICRAMQVSVSSFVNIKRLERLKSDVSLSAVVFLSLL